MNLVDRTKRGKRHGIANFDRIKQCRPSQQRRPSQPESVHRKNGSTRAVVCVCDRSLSPVLVSGRFCVGLMRADFNRQKIPDWRPVLAVAESSREEGPAIRRKTLVLILTQTIPGALAAKKTTTTIPYPARVVTLIGPERDHFLKGRLIQARAPKNSKRQV